jgi:ketosteroid isomerase-like protein
MSDVIAAMREWLELVAKGPAEAWSGKVAPEVKIRLPFAPPGVPAELDGVEAALAGLSGAWAAKETFDWREVSIRRTDDPELVVTTARSEVRLRSGRRYANTYVMLTRIRDGLVVEHVEYFNPLAVIEAYGDSAGATPADAG